MLLYYIIKIIKQTPLLDQRVGQTQTFLACSLYAIHLLVFIVVVIKLQVLRFKLQEILCLHLWSCI